MTMEETMAETEILPPKGHNMSPFDAMEVHVDDLYSEAKNWLDGQAIENDGQAQAVDALLDMLREAEKARKAAFDEEKRPHLEAGRAVDAKWKPLKERIERAVAGCRAVLTPYRQEQDRLRREEEERKRQEAEAKRREAQEALQASSPGNLDEREKAEAALEEAKKAEAAANKISREATGLRTSYEAEITDINAAVQHYWKTDREEFFILIRRLADRDAKAKKRNIPGIHISEKKVAI